MKIEEDRRRSWEAGKVFGEGQNEDEGRLTTEVTEEHGKESHDEVGGPVDWLRGLKNGTEVGLRADGFNRTELRERGIGNIARSNVHRNFTNRTAV